MHKLRSAYQQTQNNAKNNFDKVTFDRVKQIHAYANKQYDAMTAQGDYSNFQELVFYQQKFRIIVDMYTAANNDKTKKSQLQADIIAVISDNYGQPSRVQQTPQYIKEEPIKGPKLEIEPQNQRPSNQDPKELLTTFFDSKRNQIQKSKIGFRSVIETMPKSSQKYGIRSKFQVRRDNDEQISMLNSEVGTLSKKLQESKMATEYNKGLFQSQKQEYESKIKDLVSQIQMLNRQNEKIKPSSSNHFHPPLPETKFIYQYRNMVVPQIHSPHTIKYRQNDLIKIKQKIQIQPVQQTEVRSQYKFQVKPQQKGYETQRAYLPSSRKTSVEDILVHFGPSQKLHMVPTTRNYEQVQRSNFRFNKSQAEKDDKNIAIRSKLSFFKPEMVLYRGQLFQIAIKSFGLVNLDSLKIYIFVNSKDHLERNASITYSYDQNYYDVKVVRKLGQIRGLKQSKQEVHVKLNDKTDFDSMIEAKLSISNYSKEIKFFIPTMFIEFTNTRPQMYGQGLYEKETVVPMHQFANIFSAMQVIPFQKYYEDRVEVASVFARSKHNQGYLTLRWLGKGEVEINTIKPWKLLISYLISKKY